MFLVEKPVREQPKQLMNATFGFSELRFFHFEWLLRTLTQKEFFLPVVIGWAVTIFVFVDASRLAFCESKNIKSVEF